MGLSCASTVPYSECHPGAVDRWRTAETTIISDAGDLRRALTHLTTEPLAIGS